MSCCTYISPMMFSIVWWFRICVSHVCNMKYCKSISFHNAKKTKNWQGLPQGKTYYEGIYISKNKPRTPLLPIVPPTGRGSLSRLLSNAIDYCRRTEESTTLDPQWLHKSLLNWNPTCGAAWKDNFIPLLRCPPN